MYSFIFLGLGLGCALISRGLIVNAAFRIDWRWGIGVLLPFGPLAFRLKYPDEARRARPFQLAAIPCFLLFILLGQTTGSFQMRSAFSKKTSSSVPTPAKGYALEKPAASPKGNNVFASLARSTPSIEERRSANARELERLAAKAKELKLRKRDLLRSDVEGNAIYTHDVAEYDAALAKANAEKAALAAPSH